MAAQHAALTVLLPVYNGEPHVRGAIESVLRSQFTNFELLVIDDGSTDRTGETVLTLARADRRIRVVNQSHQGVVAALNRGLVEARADVVARMDADDLCMPGRLGRQYGALCDRPDVSLCSCRVEPIDRGCLNHGMAQYLGWVNASVAHYQIVRDLYIESPLPHPSVMFRAAAVQRLGGYRDYDGPEDYDLWLRMAEAGIRFHKVPDVLLQWRLHTRSLSRSDPRYRKQAFNRRKFEYVARQVASGSLAGRSRVRVRGAGANGRRLRRQLANAGVDVEAFVDVDPELVGSNRKSIPVLTPDAIGSEDDAVLYLCAVGGWGTREQIRASFVARGKVEGTDFVIL